MVLDLTLPLDNQTLASAPGVLRANFTALDSTIKVDHYGSGTTNDGRHAKITLVEGAKPANVANTGILYTKDVGGNSELFYEDQAGTETQLTSGGYISNTFKTLSVATGEDGGIHAASGKDLYVVMGDDVGVNKVSFMSSKAITAIAQSNPCSVTSVGHGLVNGDVVRIIDVVGMIELNNANYTVTKSTDDVFTLNGTNATAFTAYSSGGRFCRDVIKIASRYPRTSATISSAGAIVKSEGNIASVTRLAGGRYRITFKTAYSSVNDYGLIGSILHTNITLRSLVVYNKTVGYVDVASIDRNDASQDNEFYFILTSY